MKSLNSGALKSGESTGIMEIKKVNIANLTDDPANVRKHSEKNLAAIKGSLKKFGQQKPIVVDKRGVVIAGNGTLAAARALGWSEIDVVKSDLEGSQATAYAIADNRTGELADWDAGPLAKTLEALQAIDFDLGEIGFDDADLEKLIPKEVGTEGLTDPDAVPEQVETRCKPGDLWALGNHRLLCGDSTNVQHVERLMGGERAELCFTSPPYSQQRDYGVGKVSDWDALMRDVFSVLPIAGDGQVLVNLGLVHRDNEWIPYWDGWLEYMRAAGWRRFGLYVWDQGPGLPGDWHGRLAPAFEFVFHFNREAKRANKTKDCIHAGVKNHGAGLRDKDGTICGYTAKDDVVQPTKTPDSVIRVTRHKARGIEVKHPAVFPVELVEEISGAYSKPGQALYEPFLGSGSTLIACEKTGRRCFGMEIDPYYCDVVLSRWEQFTGKEAKLAS